jgi:hypothetical protein
MESGRSHFVMPALVAGIPIVRHGRAFMMTVDGLWGMMKHSRGGNPPEV